MHEPGSVPELGKLVHSLEHGRIHVQYRAGTHAETVAQLTAVTAELEGGYHMLLYENTTDMKPEVAVTTWGHMASCRTMNDNVFDVIRSFRNRYVDKGPEFVP